MSKKIWSDGPQAQWKMRIDDVSLSIVDVIDNDYFIRLTVLQLQYYVTMNLSALDKTEGLMRGLIHQNFERGHSTSWAGPIHIAG